MRKCKGEITITRNEVLVINLINKKDLDRLNKRFGRNWQPQKVESTARIIEEIRHDEIDKLMRQKPVGGGYAL
ncbi:MAG: hypothetical protein ACYCXQ_00915 [Candidatus Humimicrobiaceae bacterium]